MGTSLSSQRLSLLDGAVVFPSEAEEVNPWWPPPPGREGADQRLARK